MKSSHEAGLTLNEEKCSFRKTEINLLGYKISYKTLKPDPDRLKPFLELAYPVDKKTLSRLLGVFVYYSRWIKFYSHKIAILVNAKFPLNDECKCRINELKNEIANASMAPIDENFPFTVETDASNVAISGVLSQNGRPVAFFSRTLNKSERNHHSMENEAQAVVESIAKWRHFLSSREFTLITDQQAISYIFDQNHSSKIKNEKMLCWRMELMEYKYQIIYRPGKLNCVADALSRNNFASVNFSDCKKLDEIHNDLSHPGVTRMHHYVRSMNLNFTLEEIRELIANCSVCRKCKPLFYKPQNESHVIKATAPMERISIDFKCPSTPSKYGHKYLFVAIDEYSRFPFAIPCKDMTADTVINCLSEIFSLAGYSSYVHSDRGSSFICKSVRAFLIKNGVGISNSMPYHPTGNSQCERYVGIIWKTINLQIQSGKLRDCDWNLCINDALYSIRSLLCTATNQTPHERFFSFKRFVPLKQTLPSYLMEPGSVYLRKFVRNKSDPLVDEVYLHEADAKKALIEYPSGRLDTVSTKDIAPTGDIPDSFSEGNNQSTIEMTSNEDTATNNESLSEKNSEILSNKDANFGSDNEPLSSESDLDEPGPVLRRSSRVRKAPDRLNL